MRWSWLALALMVGCSGSDDGAIGPDPAADAEASTLDVDDPTMPDTSLFADVTDGSDGSDAADTADGKSDVPAPTTACQAKLVELGIGFKTTEARGVVDAVHLTGTVNGVLFANGTATTTMGDPVACEFAKTLHAFAALLKTKGFVRVGTLGSYCYRCCCAWSTTNFCRGLTDPEPVCGTSGLSNHSFGRAVDVRYLYKADGTRYDINDPTQFVKFTSTDTCVAGLAAQKAGSISLQLYTLACDATKTKVFGTVLTPNYNAVHRNHLHMDIGETGTPTSWTTKVFVPGAPLEGIDDAPTSGLGCGDE
jgi:hypothetical protein